MSKREVAVVTDANVMSVILFATAQFHAALNRAEYVLSSQLHLGPAALRRTQSQLQRTAAALSRSPHAAQRTSAWRKQLAEAEADD